MVIFAPRLPVPAHSGTTREPTTYMVPEVDSYSVDKFKMATKSEGFDSGSGDTV